MTCNDALGVLDAYLDDELLVEDRLQAHEHFARCESCRRVAKAEAALHTLMARAVTDEAVPAGLRERIWLGVEAAASRAGERPQRRRLQPGRLWLAASALVVAMLSGLLVGYAAASAVGADKLVDFALACIRSSPPVPG
jgi:anti-sigma factor (TIGR02949 family)